MDAVWIGVPKTFLEERRRLGHDTRDEVWEGVLHMVPRGSYRHGHIIAELFIALRPIAERSGLVAHPDGFGLFAPEPQLDNYRIPDVTLTRPDQISERGLEGAELVIEVRSPSDESYKKLPFYARMAVREVWIVDPATRNVEVYTLGAGVLDLVPHVGSVQRSPLLGISLEVVDGELCLRDGDVCVAI